MYFSQFLDSILIDIFLPLNQDALSGPLEFCRQEASNLDSMNRASLKSTINPSSGFLKAANELLQKALIRWHGRFISIHRMVQEAVNVGIPKLLRYFDFAVINRNLVPRYR